MTTEPADMHPAVQTVKLHLEQELHQRWTLRQLSDRVGLAPTYLAELFAKHVGKPPRRLLNERRTERPQQLLKDSGLAVTALSGALGYSSSQHFARVFRHFTSSTPTAFRSSDASR
ncbi:helix-turn-helix transcriptional regulator [Kribbella sp. NPDC050124]|uniref:helix-turn-helix transcriptional regulator n=1 Tax=Kribbella sp. NPDC050124 TaxID=3364114 RepID=UPI0037909F6E